MPKNTVTDPITDQEMAFAHLIMSGTMTDRRAAEAVGLNPDTAAYIKAKPRVRAYMNEHRAAVREKLVDEEAMCRGQAAQPEPWSRPDPHAALGAGRSQLRSDEGQHCRSDQGPLHDRSHRRLHPGPPPLPIRDATPRHAPQCANRRLRLATQGPACRGRAAGRSPCLSPGRVRRAPRP